MVALVKQLLLVLLRIRWKELAAANNIVATYLLVVLYIYQLGKRTKAALLFCKGPFELLQYFLVVGKGQLNLPSEQPVEILARKIHQPIQESLVLGFLGFYGLLDEEKRK